MSRRRKELHDHLDATMNKGVKEFIGFQVEAEWETVAVPHYILLTAIAQHVPDYLFLAPDLHEARRTLSWARGRVQVSEKVKLQRVTSKAGFITLQPHLVVDQKDDNSSDDRYDHELKTDNMPRVAMRLSDNTIVAEEPSHHVAVAMAQTFTDLKDKMHTEDVRIFVTRIIHRLGGVKKLKAASTWYVPWTTQAASVLEPLKKVVEVCRPYSNNADNAYLYVTKMPRSEADDVTMAKRSANKTFTSEYRGIFTDVESFIANMFTGKLTQNATLKERLKLSKFLRERAELYQDILEVRSDNMNAALEVIEEATEVLMDGAGEYRAAINGAKKLDDKAREAEEEAAQADLTTWAKEAEKIMARCKGILDPGEGSDEDVAEAA